MPNSRLVSKLSTEEVKQLRQSLQDIQGGACYICQGPIDLELQREAIEIDHIQPLASGGSDSKNNFALTHSECNRRKGVSHLRTARLLTELNQLQESAKGRGERGANLDHVLREYGGGTSNLRIKFSGPQVKFGFPESGDVSIQSAQLYQDELSGAEYFFALVPLAYLHHDDSINPRTIGGSIRGLIEEFQNKRPQLHVGLAWWEDEKDGSGKLKLFDGQHKAAAQIMLGAKKLPVRVFVNPDKKALMAANTNAGSTLRQVAFSKDVMRHLGSTLYQERVSQYTDQKQLSEDDAFSEQDLVKHFRAESRQMARYIIDAQRDAITQSEDNRLLEFVEWGGKGADRPMAYSAVEGSFFQLLHMKPLASPISEGLEDGTNPRQIERAQMIKLMSLFAETFFIGKWNPDIGGRKLEDKVRQGEPIPDDHLRAWRVSREEVTVNIIRWVPTVIENHNAAMGKTVDRDRLLLSHLPDAAWDNISRFLGNLAKLSCWANHELSSSVFGPKQNNDYWHTVFETGISPSKVMILQEPLVLRNMIASD